MSQIPMTWSDSRCILCLEIAPLSDEHIIPRAIGGILVIRFLCKPCNDLLGSREEAEVKKDPSIRMAIENLGAQLPVRLRGKLTDGQEFFAGSPHGNLPGVLKKGAFQIRAKKAADGSRLLPTPAGRELVKNHLLDSGVSAEMLQELLDRFDEHPENSPFRVDDSLSIVKWSLDPLRPRLNGAFLGDRVALKMGYEFLACILGKAIYSDSPSLSAARAALKDQNDLGSEIKIERLHSNKYDAFHGLAFEGNKPHATIQVRLFGWLAYRIHFGGIKVSAPRISFTHRLDSGAASWKVFPT